MEFNIEINTLMTKEQYKHYSIWHRENIGTEFEIGYTEHVPDCLRSKGYGDLVSVSVFDVNNTEFKLIQDFENNYLDDKTTMVDLYEAKWGQE